MVGVKIGSMEKHIKIFGDRYWNHAGLLNRRYTITTARPFARRSIVYEDAFGGLEPVSGHYCTENLVGKGLYSTGVGNNPAGEPLPAIEDPEHLIKNIKDRPAPVGFGFYSRAWQPRAAYAGTYDENWRKARSPLPPKDFDSRFYNGAHPDLQVDGYLRGDEVVTLINLTREGHIDFKLL